MDGHHAGVRPFGAVLAVLRPGRLLAAEALERATSIARASGRDLHVLCVVPSKARGAGPEIDRMKRAALRAERWVRDQGSPLSRPRLVVRDGDAIAAATAVAADVSASLLVVGAGRSAASDWVRLTRRLGYPVFLARSTRGSREIVAATDLLDGRVPTLVHAMRLALPRGYRVTLVHDADGVARSARHARERRLRWLAENPLVDVAPAVVSSADTPTAIADEARARGADVVVIGVHCDRGAEAETTRSRTADRIARLVACSVLLVPLPPASWIRHRSGAGGQTRKQ